MKINVDLVYPVGSIYMNLNPTNPGTLFGGTWTQISGRFILGAGGGYSAGQTGGEASHTLTQNEMPAHKHTMEKAPVVVGKHEIDGLSGGAAWSDLGIGLGTDTSTNGGGQSHNNMPPYYVVYIWRRTA